MQKRHLYHLVERSPGPLLSLLAVFFLTSGFVLYMHRIENGFSIFVLGLVMLVLVLTVGGRDVIRESTYQRNYKLIVQRGIKLWFLLFHLAINVNGKPKFFYKFLNNGGGGQSPKRRHYTTVTKTNYKIKSKDDHISDLLGIDIKTYKEKMKRLEEIKKIFDEANKNNKFIEKKLEKDLKAEREDLFLLHEKYKFIENSLSHIKMANFLIDDDNKILLVGSELTTSNHSIKFPNLSNEIGVIKVKELKENDVNLYIAEGRSCMYFNNINELKSYILKLNDNDYKKLGMSKEGLGELVKQISSTFGKGEQGVFNIKTMKLEKLDFDKFEKSSDYISVEKLYELINNRLEKTTKDIKDFKDHGD